MLRVILILLLFSLTGCQEEYFVRTTEYGGDVGSASRIIGSAEVGGCQVSTSQTKVVGRIVVRYKGEKCEVMYGDLPEDSNSPD